MILNKHEILLIALDDEGGYYTIQIDSNLEMATMNEMFQKKLFKLAKRADPFHNRFKITPKGMKLAKEAKEAFEFMIKYPEKTGGAPDGTNSSTL